MARIGSNYHIQLSVCIKMLYLLLCVMFILYFKLHGGSGHKSPAPGKYTHKFNLRGDFGSLVQKAGQRLELNTPSSSSHKKVQTDMSRRYKKEIWIHQSPWDQFKCKEGIAHVLFYDRMVINQLTIQQNKSLNFLNLFHLEQIQLHLCP